MKFLLAVFGTWDQFRVGQFIFYISFLSSSYEFSIAAIFLVSHIYITCRSTRDKENYSHADVVKYQPLLTFFYRVREPEQIDNDTLKISIDSQNSECFNRPRAFDSYIDNFSHTDAFEKDLS